MRGSQKVRVVLAGALLAMAGCECQPGQADLGEFEPYRPVFENLCDLILRCPDQQAFPFDLRSFDECMEAVPVRLTCQVDVGVSPGGKYQGRLREGMPYLTLEQVDGCASLLVGAGCEIFEGRCQADGGCDSCGLLLPSGMGGSQAVPGVRAAGLDERCGHGLGCGEGLYCAFAGAADAGVPTCSVCKPRRQQGGSCADSPQFACDDGLFCNDERLCVPRLPDDQPCRQDEQCASGFCNTRTGACDPDGYTGDVCSADEDCRLGFCRPEERVCGKLAGESCGARYPLNEDQCLASVCVSGTCVHPAAPGESCKGRGCQVGACDGDRDVCAKTCSRSGDCSSDEFCNGWGCTGKRADGAQCSWHGQCQSGACLWSGICGRAAPIGGTCANSGDCEQRYGYCGSGTCKVFASPGGPCDAPGACRWPYRCVDGRCEKETLVCEAGPAGGLCRQSVCEEGAYCDTSYRCVRSKPLGAACLESRECGDGLYCRSGACSA